MFERKKNLNYKDIRNFYHSNNLTLIESKIRHNKPLYDDELIFYFNFNNYYNQIFYFYKENKAIYKLPDVLFNKFYLEYHIYLIPQFNSFITKLIEQINISLNVNNEIIIKDYDNLKEFIINNIRDNLNIDVEVY